MAATRTLANASSVDEILAAHVSEYTENNPKSAQYHERARKVIPGGTTRAVLSFDPFPLTFSGGHDTYVTSVDGREYLDMVSEYNAGMYGKSHPALLEAIQRAAKTGFNLGGPNEREVELAEKLVRRFPSVDTIRFCNSGTEANTMAIATALNFVRRKKVMVFKNAYHGGTLMFGATRNPLNLPHEWAEGTFNDIEATRSQITNDIGVILIEPMQGVGGMLPGRKDFLEFLRSEATRIGAILIFDEIITSRLFYGGLQEYMGVTPDMTTIGKHFGGGFTFGAFGGRRDIMAQYDPQTAGSSALQHSGTWNNNMFSMTSGCVGADLLSREALERTAKLGERLRKGLREVFTGKLADIVTISGISSVTNIAILGDHGVKLRHVLYFHLLNRGIYASSRGFMSLNITHKEEHVDRVLGAMREFADAVSANSNLSGAISSKL